MKEKNSRNEEEGNKCELIFLLFICFFFFVSFIIIIIIFFFYLGRGSPDLSGKLRHSAVPCFKYAPRSYGFFP